MTASVRTRLLLVGVTTMLICASASVGRAERGVSLMGMLAEWQYPGSKFNGATASDGGNPTLQSIKCKAVLTTPDPMKKVIEFYAKKLGLSPDPDARAADGKPASAKARSVTVQDDSKGRPLAIHVIVVHQEKSTTTLVISRSKAESETHIAWSHYLRL